MAHSVLDFGPIQGEVSSIRDGETKRLFRIYDPKGPNVAKMSPHVGFDLYRYLVVLLLFIDKSFTTHVSLCPPYLLLS